MGTTPVKLAIHGAIYQWARPWVENKLVLDVGCAEGFGAVIFAQSAKRVIAIDQDPVAIAEACAQFKRQNVHYQVMDCQSLAIKSDSVDVLFCNALLEYLRDVPGFFQEAQRVLKPGGTVLCGTKNLKLSLKNHVGKPLYKNHLQEYTPESLHTVMTSYFNEVKVYGEHMAPVAEKLIADPAALKLEGRLVKLGIKKLFPRKLRIALRRMITGIDAHKLQPQDFFFSMEFLDDALYLVAVGAKESHKTEF